MLALAGNPDAQCRNSYGRVRQRLERCGYGGDRAVWIQNFTSGQEWRLARMGLWPEYFGQTEHGLAVSFGAQAKMSGLNMITTVVLALTPEVERVAVVPQPRAWTGGAGRARGAVHLRHRRARLHPQPAHRRDSRPRRRRSPSAPSYAAATTR